MSRDNFFSLINEHQIEFIDFRFTDMQGKWHHISKPVRQVSENLLKLGFVRNDLNLMPDLDSLFLDPFTTMPTLIVICDATSEQDPRLCAKRSIQFLIDSAIGDEVLFGMGLEFFIFDDVRFNHSSNDSFIKISHEELPESSKSKYKSGNYAHRALHRNAQMLCQPIDSLNDIRAEIVTLLKATNIEPLSHHHARASSQSKIDVMPELLLKMADNIQKYKYVVHNVAHSYGKTASFMPKPMGDEFGSAMYLSQMINKNQRSIFHDENICLYYMGGIIKHAKALNVFLNSSSNSYRRLRSEFDIIPNLYSQNEIIIDFADASSNPYLALSSILMAGMDGIINKIDPQNFSNEERKLSRSLDEALDALEQDNDFLQVNNVFTKNQIEAYIKLKRDEQEKIAKEPHPLEFKYYYSL